MQQVQCGVVAEVATGAEAVRQVQIAILVQEAHLAEGYTMSMHNAEPDEPRNYLDEAVDIAEGVSVLLAQREHVVALWELCRKIAKMASHEEQ